MMIVVHLSKLMTVIYIYSTSSIFPSREDTTGVKGVMKKEYSGRLLQTLHRKIGTLFCRSTSVNYEAKETKRIINFREINNT